MNDSSKTIDSSSSLENDRRSPLNSEELIKCVQILQSLPPSDAQAVLKWFVNSTHNFENRQSKTVASAHVTVEVSYPINQQPSQRSQVMDPATIATTAVALLSPYLVKMGESAAEKIGESSAEAGGKLLGWMRGKLTGRAREALDDLEKTPAAEDNQADLRKQIAKALAADPALAAELAALLPAAAAGDTLTANATGQGAVANVTKGNNIQTFIQGGG